LWQWGERTYRAVPPEAGGRIWSEQLALWLGYDEDGFLRLYTREGEMLLTQEEEAERADAEAQRADAAVQRADAEAQRRMDAERRLSELTAELERLRRGNSSE